MEAGRAKQSWEPPRPLHPSRPGKGKEVATPDDVDLPADDELSSNNFLLLRRSPSPNAVEAQSRKRPPCQPSRSISVVRPWVRRKPSRDQRLSTPAHRYVPDQAGGLPPPAPSMYPPFGAPPHRRFLFPPSFGDHSTFSPLPLDRISWTKILPAAFPYHPSPCTTVLPICTITCYTITRQ